MKIAVLGAGIAGVSTAYFLKKRGVDVTIIDRSIVPASGGSGAAGAFVAPKIGKGGSLQELTNRAFDFAKDFYPSISEKFFHQSGVLRIPKNIDDIEKFPIYEKFNYPDFEIWDRDKILSYGYRDTPIGFFFPSAGDCDAPLMCQEIAKDISFIQMSVNSIDYKDSKWILKDSSKSLAFDILVLSTGWQNSLLDMRYMGIKGLWGSRGDYKSKNNLKISIHKDFSISSTRDGIIKLGATHIKSKEPCVICNGKPLETLESKAKNLLTDYDLEHIETFCGMRSGSRDHFPVVGGVIDVQTMLKEYPKITKGAKAELIHFPNLYILNGLGGRGFVFAPLMAKELSEYIFDKKEINPKINPDRLFWKWVRKN